MVDNIFHETWHIRREKRITVVANIPLLALILVFDQVSALIVSTQHCAVSWYTALTAWNWLGTSYGPVQHNWKRIHQCDLLSSHEGHPVWKHTQRQYCKPLRAAACEEWVGHVQLFIYSFIFLCIPVRRSVNEHLCAICQPLLTHK